MSSRNIRCTNSFYRRHGKHFAVSRKNLRFFRSERGFQGEFYCQLKRNLKIATHRKPPRLRLSPTAARGSGDSATGRLAQRAKAEARILDKSLQKVAGKLHLFA